MIGGLAAPDCFTVRNTDLDKLNATTELIRLKTIGIKFGNAACDQQANATTSVVLDLSDTFSTILSASGSARTTVPGDKNVGVMVNGTKVTLYLHNDTVYIGTMGILYIVIGILK